MKTYRTTEASKAVNTFKYRRLQGWAILFRSDEYWNVLYERV